tara:strand:- start:9587 stop:10372 length:786 start_codon:yes stop_codon:yes gene_type:complete
MRKHLFVGVLSGIILLPSCKKIEGSGGTSAINGNLSGRTYNVSNVNDAEQELTHITIPNGNTIEDGDYILLNTPLGGPLYYLWFKWDNGLASSPGLSGRTPIQVTYSFTQSNTTIAQMALSAIAYVAGDHFLGTLNNDIISLENRSAGEVTDAEEFSQNFTVDVANQGENEFIENDNWVDGSVVNERVYLIYGDEVFYSEDVRTDADGNYQFRDLNRGNYTIYAYSKDSLDVNGLSKTVSVNTTITERKQIVQAPNLFIYQ